MENFKKFRALVALVPALFFTSCDKAQDPAPTPQVVGIANVTFAPVPCMSEGYSVDANGVGAYQLPSPRFVGMTTAITGLSYLLRMEQIKYTITPNGKELSVWQGVDYREAPLRKETYSCFAWSECDKRYESKCVRFPDGKVTLSLTTN